METCAYCGEVIDRDKNPYLPGDTNAQVPRSDENDWWHEEAKLHIYGCEWVLTRAHRIDPKRYTVRQREDGRYYPYAWSTYGESPHWHAMSSVGYDTWDDAVDVIHDDATDPDNA